MRYLIILILFCGCAGLQLTYDKQGRISEIKSTGFLPGKRKIDNCEVDTKLSLFDFNLFKK